jgi:hypothetical protein
MLLEMTVKFSKSKTRVQSMASVPINMTSAKINKRHRRKNFKRLLDNRWKSRSKRKRMNSNGRRMKRRVRNFV